MRDPVQPFACQVPISIWKRPVAVLYGLLALGLKLDSARAIRTITGASGKASATKSSGVGAGSVEDATRAMPLVEDPSINTGVALTGIT